MSRSLRCVTSLLQFMLLWCLLQHKIHVTFRSLNVKPCCLAVRMVSSQPVFKGGGGGGGVVEVGWGWGGSAHCLLSNTSSIIRLSPQPLIMSPTVPRHLLLTGCVNYQANGVESYAWPSLPCKNGTPRLRLWIRWSTAPLQK